MKQPVTVATPTIATSSFTRLLRSASAASIAVTQENFDMVLGQSTYFNRGVQALMEVLKSPGFRERFEHLGGYGFEDSGKILYSNI